jgi:hypothetical protein
MAKGDYVSFKVEQYKPNMETDANFEAISFRFVVPEDSKGDIKLTNKFRGEKIREYCKLYDVKPLGAAAPAGKTVDKALIQTLFKLAKGDVDRVLKAYLIKNPSHEITAEKITAMCASTEQSAKDLLAQV